MHKIAERRLSVNELRDLVGDDLSTISKHLGLLQKSGIMKREKEGTCVYYSFRNPCIMNFMDCIEELIKENALDDLKSL